MKKQFLDIILPILCIVLAFFLWYMYAYREWEVKNASKENTKHYIDISTSSKGITIKNTPENIFFRIDGELIQSGSIDLK